jgi:hypothetical protein
MRIRTLMAVVLAGLASAPAGARGEAKGAGERVAEVELKRKAAQLLAAIKGNDEPDPESPMRVRLSYPGALFECRAPAPSDSEVASGPKGTTIRVPTYGLGAGSANLTFQNCAPPMRFTVTLTGAQGSDLSRLTLSSGSLTLAVDGVGTTSFDARGRPCEREEGAAFTVRVERGAGGEVQLHVRRGPGAALGKAVSVRWQHRSSR